MGLHRNSLSVLFLIEIQQEGVYGVEICGFVVGMADEKVGRVWGVGKRAIKVGGDEVGLEIREHHAFETHLNLISDFTGSRERMSMTTSFGSQSDMVVEMEESGTRSHRAERVKVKSGPTFATSVF
ncbi:hypothetical protein SLA2020_400680 [Shorea laevis]